LRYTSLDELGEAAREWNLSGPALIMFGAVYREAAKGASSERPIDRLGAFIVAAGG
jgi:hypothetical protein